MRVLQVLREGVVLLDCVQSADTFVLRLRGLLGVPEPGFGRGLLICPCSAVHTLGMRYPIDVVFLNLEGEVVKTAASLAPQRWASATGASQVLEARAGTIAEHRICVNDRLQLDTDHESR